MDATATQLTDIKFNEAKRGYDPVEVDNFLEKLGDAVVKLQDKVREANRRADDAERRVGEAQRAASSAEKRALDAEAQMAMGGGSASEDELTETLKKTLLLAQRTADETVKEAKADAATLRADAEQAAALLVEDANRTAAQQLAAVEEEIGARRSSETVEMEEQVKRLEDVRVKLVADVEALEAHLDEVRERMRAGVESLTGILDDDSGLRAPSRPTLSAPPAETVLGGRPSKPSGPVPIGGPDEAAGTTTATHSGEKPPATTEDGAADGPTASAPPITPTASSSKETPAARASAGAPARTPRPPAAPPRIGSASQASSPGASSSGASSSARSDSSTRPPPASPVGDSGPRGRAPSSAPTSDEASARLFPPENGRTGAPMPGPASAGLSSPAGDAPSSTRGAPAVASEGAGAERGARTAATKNATADEGPLTQPVSVIERGPAPRDDGFLDELRKAADDDPLGPMDAEADAAMQAFFTEDDEDLPKRPRFGRRR